MSGKRERDDRRGEGSGGRRDPDEESDDSSSEEERVEVKRRKGADCEILPWAIIGCL
jgi:hypothetical protein